MAYPLRCDMNPAHVADVLMGNLETGKQDAFCANCFSLFALALVKETVEPEVIFDALGPVFVKVPEAPKAEAPRARSRKRAPAAAAEPEPVDLPKPGEPEVEAAAQDG